MVKTKNNVMCYDFIKALWNFKYFAKKFPVWKLGVYNLILLLIVVALNVLSYNEFTSLMSLLGTAVSVFFGTPLLFFAGFLFFAVFLNAFEGKKRGFWESFLVFFGISLPFAVLGHLMSYFSTLTSSSSVLGVLGVFVMVLLTYFVVVLIMNFKNYYSTSGWRIVASLILADLVYVSLGVFVYLGYLISQIQG